MDMEATRPTLPTKTLRMWCVCAIKLDKAAVKANNARTGSTSCKANLCKSKIPSGSGDIASTPFSSSGSRTHQTICVNNE